MSLAHNRNTLRKLIRSYRRQLSLSEQEQAAIDVNHHLQYHDNVIKAKRIAIYLANDGELDTTPFIEWCWQQGKEVYLPVLHPFSQGHLLFLAYTKDTPMTENHYGIREPSLDVTKVSPLAHIDVLFTPLVAFDKEGNRLGMGGGFYDRTLSRWQHDHDNARTAKPYPIGLAHNCQLVESVPTEHWDIPLPEIVTPEDIHVWRS